MVEVFKTNIDSKSKAYETLAVLRSKYPKYKIHFDPEDCDNILRIESHNGPFEIYEITAFLSTMDVEIAVLPD